MGSEPEGEEGWVGVAGLVWFIMRVASLRLLFVAYLLGGLLFKYA